MKKLNRLFKPGVIVALISMVGTTANADVVDGNAVASLIAPLSIAENSAMDFGTLSGGPSAGIVVLTTAGTRNTDPAGDIQIIGNDGAAGVFTIAGESGQNYIITFSAEATISDGLGNSMTVDTFDDTSLGTLPDTTEIFQVGANLNLGVDQPGGAYSTANTGGSPYTITVNYQ